MNKTIYALGFFDGVHIGHAALLSACRALAAEQGCRAGAVTFDAHPDTLVHGQTPALINSPPGPGVAAERKIPYGYGGHPAL